MAKITLGDAIAYFDEQVPNTVSRENKIKWLSECDEDIFNTYISTHEGADIAVFDGYDDNTDSNTKMLVPTPHTELYRYYLEHKAAITNREINNASTALAMYESHVENYSRWYNREHRVKSKHGFVVRK